MGRAARRRFGHTDVGLECGVWRDGFVICSAHMRGGHVGRAARVGGGHAGRAGQRGGTHIEGVLFGGELVTDVHGGSALRRTGYV